MLASARGNCARFNRLKTEAQRLGIHEDTLRGWTRLRIVPSIQIGRTIMFEPAEVDRALKKHERRAVVHSRTN